MIQSHVYIAASLDGFIARENGDLEWLEKFQELTQPGEDYGYSEFLSKMDCLILGRGTFEKVLSFKQWPYEGKTVVVLTQSRTWNEANIPQGVLISSETPKTVLKRMQDKGYKNAYIDGGKVIQSFLRENLINSLTITQIPLLLGRGIQLFGELQRDIELELIQSKSWPLGFVQSRYRVRATPQT
jgi:dihydrofolate reductase